MSWVTFSWAIYSTAKKIKARQKYDIQPFQHATVTLLTDYSVLYVTFINNLQFACLAMHSYGSCFFV